MFLSLNTSTLQFSLALMSDDGALVAESLLFGGSKNFRPFMSALHHLLGSTRSDIKDITALAVVTGPGSFTGLRIGLSVAKGICQGLKIPIIGVSSLEAMASQFPFTPYTICPLIDSRKGEFFAALFRWSDDEGVVSQGFRSRLPKLKADEVLLENAFTFEKYRGKGIMPSVQVRLAELAKSNGFKRMLAYIHQDNLETLPKVFERIGFQKFEEISELKLLFLTKRSHG